MKIIVSTRTRPLDGEWRRVMSGPLGDLVLCQGESVMGHSEFASGFYSIAKGVMQL